MQKQFKYVATALAVLGILTGSFISSFFLQSQKNPSPPNNPTTNAFLRTIDVLPDITQKPIAFATMQGAQVVQQVSNFPESVLNSEEFVVNGVRYPLIKYKALATPNDPNATQWWTTQTGLPAAWDYGQGEGAKIAIIDSGFALNHEEFAGRWMENTGEKGVTITESSTGANCTKRGLALDKSCNGLDDDANGYIDDFRGWDFSADDNDPQAGTVNPSGSGAGHATGVTGAAAATGNNGVGIAGVSWKAKILPLQALSDDGSGNTLGIARAIRYAADRGVDVINLSLGADQEDSYSRQAISYAIEKGVLVVAAAGNDGCDCLSYPAYYPEVVAVGASKPDGSVASFSSYGANVDITAPGQGMTLPYWRASEPANGYSSNLAGTSFAAPYISGLMANARAKQPSATWGQLLNTVLANSDRRDRTVQSPRSELYGYGYVKADAAMSRLSNQYNQLYRYSFGLLNSDALDAGSAMECENGQLPTAPFYEINNNSSIGYSISEQGRYKAISAGATVVQKGSVCVGLSTDRITVPRLINPAREFSNYAGR